MSSGIQFFVVVIQWSSNSKFVVLDVLELHRRPLNGMKIDISLIGLWKLSAGVVIVLEKEIPQ
jgi:hypothetical protein